jgi:hypothetical protein
MEKEQVNQDPEFNFDFPEFDFWNPQEEDDNTGIESEFETRYITPPKTKGLKMNQMKYRNAEKLAFDLEMHKDSRYFVLVDGSFIFGDFIEALVVKNDWHVKRMMVITLSMNENNVDSLHNLIAGNYIDQLDLIVSAYFYSHERQTLIPYIYQQLDIDDKFQLTACSTHCKFCTIETHTGQNIVIHGSANLRSSNNIEQIIVEDSEKLLNFIHTNHEPLIERFKTIRKPIRNREQWQLLRKEPKQSQRKEEPTETPEIRLPPSEDLKEVEEYLANDSQESSRSKGNTQKTESD